MIIKIVFYKSSSKFYDSVCTNCGIFENFIQNKSENILTLTFEELKEHFFELKHIMLTIKNWSKTEYYIDEKEATISDIDNLFTILNCEKSYENEILSDEFCYSGAGWGCNSLSSISLRKGYYSYRSTLCWYDIGHFEGDIWIVDKERIMQILTSETTTKNLNLCKHFQIDKIEKTVENLPDKIDVTEDGEWEYKYREAPMGMQQTEIIGIKPKEQYSSFRGGFSISLDGNNDENNETTEEEKNIPSTTFDDIGGIDSIVQQVREVIELPLIAPELFSHYHIKPHKGILLYGPPGCGKTLIAKAIANEIKAHFVSINGPEILNKYIGQSEENLRKIFDEAKHHSPAVIYFDEFDSISSTRDSDDNPHMATVVNQLLTLMDGIDENNQICAIASTNRIDMIDEAIKRPGRFDYVIEIQRPSPEGCKAIFRIHTEKMPVDKHFNKDVFVDKYLVGSSGAEIAFVASEAAYNSIRRTVNIKELFDEKCDFVISKENILIEEDFIKAAKLLKDSRQRADTAKWRNIK